MVCPIPIQCNFSFHTFAHTSIFLSSAHVLIFFSTFLKTQLFEASDGDGLMTLKQRWWKYIFELFQISPPWMISYFSTHCSLVMICSTWWWRWRWWSCWRWRWRWRGRWEGQVCETSFSSTPCGSGQKPIGLWSRPPYFPIWSSSSSFGSHGGWRWWLMVMIIMKLMIMIIIVTVRGSGVGLTALGRCPEISRSIIRWPSFKS